MNRFARPVAASLILISLAAGAVPSSGAAAATEPAGAVRNPKSSFPIFFDLFGTWRGEGKVGGLPATVAMTWGPALDGRFVRLSWKNDMQSTSGEVLKLEGEATYRSGTDADGKYAGTWFDSQGNVYPLLGRPAGDSLATVWGADGGPQGRTTYRLTDRKTIRVHEEVRRDGQWRTFGVSTLVKQPTVPSSPTD